MFLKRSAASLFSFSVALVLISVYRVAGAQTSPTPLITQSIDENQLATLAGNTRPEATAAYDAGAVAADLPMNHMLLQLRRSPEREQAFEKFLGELQDPKSPNYHHWLTAQQIGANYGPAASDQARIVGWLKSGGFTVNRVLPNGLVIDFSGTAGQVTAAFHTAIHHLKVRGKMHIANMSDPQIPAALAPAVVGVVSLNNFQPQPLYKRQPNYTLPCSDVFTSTCYAVAPADLATIYNLNPLFNAGITGQGETIAVVEEGNMYDVNDWQTFRQTFGLTGYTGASLTPVNPGGCTDPGVIPDVELEATIDTEWATAAAPNAAIIVASCESTNATGGELLALQGLINSSASLPDVVSISYGEAESMFGAATNASISSLYQTAVGEGVSVFVASGDSASASADEGIFRGGFEDVASLGVSVSGEASTPYNVAVGGTDFDDTATGTNSKYWSATNTPTFGSALSYVPEIPWNGSCAGEIAANFAGFSSTYGAESLCNNLTTSYSSLLNVVGGGGGPSACATGTGSAGTPVVSGTCAGYPKPVWQSVPGNPNDGVRDLPDVALFASVGPWGHSYSWCDSNPADNAPPGGCGTGIAGTSFASPIMAGIQALVDQHTGSMQGNPNPVYYALATREFADSSSACNSSLGNQISPSCIFNDVTAGDNVVPCAGNNNCYSPSGSYGVLSTSNSAFQPAYHAASGWDFATGLGSVNAYNLVMAYQPAPTPMPTVSASVKVTPASVNFGKVKVGNTKTRVVTLTNTSKKNGGQSITFSGAGLTGSSNFSLTTTCTGNVPPKGKCKVTIAFTPSSAGSMGANVTVEDNASNRPQGFGVSGTGKPK